MQPLVDAALALALWPGLWAVALHTALHSVRALQQIIHDELSDLEDMQPRKKKKGRSATITRGYILGLFVSEFV